MSEEWCDHCDLPKATCLHGRPPPPPPPARTPTSRAPRAPRAVRPAKAATPRSVTFRASAKQFTSGAELRPHILAVLADHDGALGGEDLMSVLGERLDGVLLARDHEPVPGGELRWQRAARLERPAMTQAGLLEPGRSSESWRLPRA